MKIERITLHTVEMALVSPFETSFGREEVRPAILAELRAGGLRGWGECVAGDGPWYGYETVQTALHVLKDFLIPLLLRAEWDHPKALPERFAPVRGHPMAKAALEAACWDLWAQAQGVPLARALGGGKAEIESGVSVGVQPDLDALVRTVEGYRADGYGRVKIKIKRGWDLAPVGALRRALPGLSLQVDANAAYTLDDLDLFRELDGCGLLMIEQPLGHDDLADHAGQRAHRQHQGRAGGGPEQRGGRPRPVPRARRAGVVRRDAGDGHRPRGQRGPGQPAGLHAGQRPLGQRPLLPTRPDRPAVRAQPQRHAERARRAGPGCQRRPQAAGRGDRRPRDVSRLRRRDKRDS